MVDPGALVNLRNILPQLIAVAVLVLPPLIRAFMSGNKKSKSTPRASSRPRTPSAAQKQAAQQWHQRQEALRRKRQTQIDARRAQLQARRTGRPVAAPTAADLEQRRREVIAELTRRAGAHQQSTGQVQTSAAQRASTSAGRPVQPGPRRSHPTRSSAPSAQPISTMAPPPSAPIIAPPMATSRETSRLQRQQSERRHMDLHDLVTGRKPAGRRRLSIGGIPVSARSLRQAVVLKEILDPPLALR